MPETSAAPTATPEPTAERNFVCDDPLGCVVVRPNEPIRIAYMLAMSGAKAMRGVDSKRGMQMAVDALEGRLLGHPIEIVGEDSGCSPEGGQVTATRISADERIVGVIGTSCSNAARVAAPVISASHMVLISPSNTAPYLTDPATRVPGYFRTAYNAAVQGDMAAEFAINDLGVRRAATIHNGSAHTQQVAEAFGKQFQQLGGEIVARAAVNVGDTDMRPVLTQVAAQTPDLLFYPVFVAEGALITAQAREVPGLEGVILMGADGMFSPYFVQAAGEAAEGMYVTGLDFAQFAPEYQQFLQEYEDRYGEKPPDTFHAHAYDATMLLLEGIQRVALEDSAGTLYIPRQALREAIASMANFQGLTGNLTCNPDGDCADPHIAVYQITAVHEWDPGAPDRSPIKVFSR